MRIYYYKQEQAQGDLVYFRVFTGRQPAALKRVRIPLRSERTNICLLPQVELLEFDLSVLNQRLAYNLLVAESQSIPSSVYAAAFARATLGEFILLHNGARASMGR